MIKLSRYLKRYIPLLIIAIVLLFAQALLDLDLPNKMSNIVNIGIQQSGIEEIAPKAVTHDAFTYLGLFMPDEDYQMVQQAYVPYAELSAEKKIETDKLFPKAKEMQAQVLMQEKDASGEIGAAFARADYAFFYLLDEMAKANGQNLGEASEVSAEIDMDELALIMPVIAQMPKEAFTTAVEISSEMPSTVTESIAAMLNKGFYKQLGADIGEMQTRYILKTGLYMLLLSALIICCAVGVGFCFARMGAGVAGDLRRDVFAKVSSFTNTEMDKFSTASLITRTTNDVTQVQMLYTMGMRMLVYAPIMGIGGIIMARRKSTEMSWVIAVAVAAVLALIAVMYFVVIPKFKKMQKLTDELNLVARENLTGLLVVRAFGTQKFQGKRFESANKKLTDNGMFVGRALAILMPIMTLVMSAISLLIVWVGADQISKASIQVGDMMAFIQYAMQVVMAFLFIAMVFVMVPRAAVSAERIDEVLRSESKIKDAKTPKTFTGRAKGLIKFENVSFAYEGADENVLEKISFTAKPGETTAFIGSTGSGKSTLINLIPRFYDVTDGKITVDGIDVRDITQHELRENIGYVPQKGLLFAGDISENLRFGAENASDEVLNKAVEVAQASEFIKGLDDGFATKMSQGGTTVSGGQRQRLSIARALVKKAPIYIFDDSFSALDFATDAKLRAALKPYTKESAVLVVAQRISSIMHAEQIVVMDSGKMVGTGTHKDLLKNCQAYREIAESQLTEEELA